MFNIRMLLLCTLISIQGAQSTHRKVLDTERLGKASLSTSALQYASTTQGIQVSDLPTQYDHPSQRHLFSDLDINSRISDGIDADPVHWDFMAALYYNGEFLCGATLINDRVLLTAAHCATNDPDFLEYERLTAKIGIGNINANTTEYGITRIVVPTSYWSTKTMHPSDIALLLLDRPSPNAQVTLATPNTDLDEERFLAAGWGGTSPATPSSVKLQQVWLDSIPNFECVGLHEEVGMENTMAEKALCAGGVGDTCEGDSGGPLMARAIVTGDGAESDTKLYQIGITSYGPPKADYPCGSGAPFGVYTDVRYYKRWISDMQSLYNMRGSKPPTRFNSPEFRMCYSGGGTIKTVTVPSKGACCEACRKESECKGWTWSSKTGNCYFKGADGWTRRSEDWCTSGTFYDEEPWW